MSLDEIRKEIDHIDKELIRLFCQRMECSKKVAENKSQNNIPILNVKREKEILNHVFTEAGEYSESTRLLYSTILELSRALQHDMLGSGAELRNTILNAQNNIPFNASDVRLACFGKEGTFAHAAARKVFPHVEPIFCGKFRNVFEAVSKGEAEFGIIPIENSSAGSVIDVYDLMLEYRFYICTAVDIPINECLAVLPDTKLEDIQTVYSHPQALAQCAEFLNTYNLQSLPYESTALAATMVAEKKNKAYAAICSEEGAENSGLEILRKNIQTNKNNCTRFIVISKNLSIPDNAEKISLCFSLPHVTGSLYSTLCRFAAHGLNLTKIESRPMVGKAFEYLFYLDFTGNVHNEPVLNLLCALSDEMAEFSFLGNYKEV